MAGAVKECSPASLRGGWNFIQKEVADFKLVPKSAIDFGEGYF